MKKFPNIIPVFPLSGVIYFPKTNLPLNIFEKRYLDLVNDAYSGDKLMGMVQSKKDNSTVYDIGCLGKISDYQKSKDGRILINLTGVSRFKILKARISELTGSPGEVVNTPLTIACKNGSLDIIEIQPEGKKAMNIKQFLLGKHSFTIGKNING